MGMMGTIRRARDAAGREQGFERGQSTVELVTALPILLVVAFIVVNATLFLSECAAFDRLAPQAVRVHAASPAYGQDVSAGKDLVQRQLEAAFPEENLSVEVAVRETAGGMLSFDATLRFFPTLFGLGLRTEVLGVALPQLSHTVACTVDRYKPGVIV